MIPNDSQQKAPELTANNYKQQKMDFLDSLQPNDFRNPASFNQIEMIIEQLNQALDRVAINKGNSEKFINKVMANLFRADSSARLKAINLLNAYLQIKFPII